MEHNEKYDFSFTASSLRLNEMIEVAVYFKKKGPKEADLIHQIGNGKMATGKRIFRECTKRLAALTREETDLLIENDLTTQRQMAFLAICKVHQFIKDFTIEVLREKLLLFDYEMSDGDFISFFRRKTEVNPEMENLKASTQKKIKQVTFKVLEQAGLIDDVKTKKIQPQILDRSVTRTIAKDDPAWLKIFLLSDAEIAEVTR